MTNKENGYIIAFDLINIAACISVIILHVNGAFWYGPSYDFWKSTVFAETAFYWAVPAFFMLSGATLMDYRTRYTTAEYFKKRFSKTLIPFLIWSIISIPWAVFITHQINFLNISTWQGVVNTIINTEAMPIYWFFLPLFVIYLSIPALSAIPEHNRKSAFGYIIVCAFILDSFLPTVASLFGVSISSELRFPLNGGEYILFVLLGYYISTFPISKKARFVTYLAGILGWASRYFYTLIRSVPLGEIDRGLTGYTKFPSVLLAVAVFVWFFYFDWSFLNKPNIIKLIRKVSGASFGVYLVHNFILMGLVIAFKIPMGSLTWRVLGIPTVYCISLIIVLVGKKIPVIKKMFP